MQVCICTLRCNCLDESPSRVHLGGMATLIDLTPSGRKHRHPEKQARPDTPILRKPDWIRVKAPTSAGYAQTREIVKSKGLITVCEEASCPNIGECWDKKHATMMILGDVCTRACSFCNVSTGKPLAGVDVAIRSASPRTTIEILTPDFLRKDGWEHRVIDARPDVFNHNLETVPRLYLTIRPGARYFHSLRLLQKVKDRDPSQFTKSGLMVGLGETKEEVMQVMDDMRSAGVDFLTIGQYLQPTRKHAAIDRFVTPEEFKALEEIARAKGFLMVSATPLTRSSYHAGEDFARMRDAREAKLAGLPA